MTADPMSRPVPVSPADVAARVPVAPGAAVSEIVSRIDALADLPLREQVGELEAAQTALHAILTEEG